MTDSNGDNPPVLETPQDAAPDTAEILRRAEAAVAALRHRYLSVAEADLARLAEAAARLDQPASDQAAILDGVHRAAHDMKGQGATFDYPLVTAIAASLCRLVKGRTRSDGRIAAIVAAHVTALRTVIEGRLAGEGDDAIRAMAAALEHDVSTALAQ